MPQVILCISAHWMTEGTWITYMEKQKTIHDFYGFPKELFDIQYPAVGSSEMAKEISKVISTGHIQFDDQEWGLDHGTWSVLKHLYPKADIPVMGFSQGSIMTMGLLLQSSLDLSHYICFSGRTLPEFEDFALKNPNRGNKRKVFLAHGKLDNTLPINHALRSKEILEAIKADLTYKEFDGGHGVDSSTIFETKNWLIKK